MGIAEFVIGFIMLIAGAAISANQKRSDRGWQEDMYEKQLEDQREDRQTEYQLESPVALAQQYKSAGLNPLGINAGNGSVNHVASSMPQTNASSSYFDPLSTIQGAASMANMSKQMKLQETQAELTNEKTRAEAFKIWQEGMEKQIANGFLPEQLQQTIEEIKTNIAKGKVDKEYAQRQLDFLEDAKAKGINPVVDDHNRVVAETDRVVSDKLNQQELTKSKLATEKMQRGLIALQQKHQKLSNAQYEQEVKEFLDSEYYRKYFLQSQAYLTSIANDAAERADLLDSLNNETERILAQQILNLAKDGESSFDAVFARWLTSNPTALVNVIGQFASFVPGLKAAKSLN